MRTKQLFLTAVLGVATSVGAMAQVYSANVVGYVNIDLPAGFTMIANPLNLMGGSNAIGEVIPTAPDGATVFVWNGAGFDPSITYYDGLGWYDGNFELATTELNPGGGVFINMPSPSTITFVGEVPQGDLGQSLATGFSIISKLTPDTASLSDAGFPATDGDTLFFWNGNGFDPAITYYDGLGWYDGDFNEQVPAPAAGQALFVNKAGAGEWTRTFNVQ